MTNENERSGPVPEWLVERFAAGELPREQADEIRGRLAAEPGGLERLNRLADSNAEILAAYPSTAMAVEIQRRAAAAQASVARTGSPEERAAVPTKPRRRGLWVLTLGTPAVAVAALALVLWSSPRSGSGPVGGVGSGRRTTEDGDHIKGLRPSLRVYRKVGAVAERLAPGATAHAGDQLQLAYVAAGHRFGAVLSVDGTGHVTFHLPATVGPATRLRTDGEVALADAYELDAAPGFEQFVFVSGNAPFDTAALGDVVRGTAPAPAGTVLVSFTVRKE